MTLSIIGSIKINSRWRKKLFMYNLASLKPISSILSWRINIVGKYANFARQKIEDSYENSLITTDDNTPYYQLIKTQTQNCNSNLLLFWMEDHLFICSNKNLFYYLLQKFNKSNSEILTITHLITSWQRKHFLPVVAKTYLYTEYAVNPDSQSKLIKTYPEAYLTGLPAIYKKDMALEILEFNKNYLGNSNHPGEYELYGKKALEFLKKRKFIEMVPKFHVFREVFKKNHEERSININDALKILKLRNKGKI